MAIIIKDVDSLIDLQTYSEELENAFTSIKRIVRTEVEKFSEEYSYDYLATITEDVESLEEFLNVKRELKNRIQRHLDEATKNESVILLVTKLTWWKHIVTTRLTEPSEVVAIDSSDTGDLFSITLGFYYNSNNTYNEFMISVKIKLEHIL